MSGYIRFAPTGNDGIDKILDAVKDAGDWSRHTSGWQEGDDGEPSLVDLIQAAANAAAASAPGGHREISRAVMSPDVYGGASGDEHVPRRPRRCGLGKSLNA